MLNIIRLLSLLVSRTGGIKRLNRGRQARPRRFWVPPRRTSAWWDNFVDQILIMVPFSVTVAFSCVDADIFFLNGEKNLRFQTKTDTCGRSLILGTVTTTQQTRVIFFVFFSSLPINPLLFSNPPYVKSGHWYIYP